MAGGVCHRRTDSFGGHRGAVKRGPVRPGDDGLHVHVFCQGVSGAIAHSRTRRRARAIARDAVASMLRVDSYAFDLEVDGA